MAGKISRYLLLMELYTITQQLLPVIQVLMVYLAAIQLTQIVSWMLTRKILKALSVLKGAAAAALYGSRAADGVVIITTKKGAEGAVKVNVNSKVSTSWANKLPEAQT